MKKTFLDEDYKTNLNEDAESLVEKWSDVLDPTSGLMKEMIEGAPSFRDDKQRAQTAFLLERVEQEVLKESTLSGDVARYNPVLIPMIRRMYPALIGPSIFGMQPMSQSTGTIFSLTNQYTGTTDAGYKKDNSVIIRVDDTSAAVVGEQLSSSDDGVGYIRGVEGLYVLVQVTAGSFDVADTVDYGTATYAADEGTITDVFDNEQMIPMIFSNYTGTYTTADGEALSTDMAEAGFNIESLTVTAKTRKLKTKWTLELEEDLNSTHGMSAEQLLSQICSTQIAGEINKELINYARTLAEANTTTTFDYSAADGRWEVEKYQNLVSAISRESRAIGFDTKQGQGNFIIANPGALTALEMTGRLDTTGIDPTKTSYAGKLLGYMDVYLDNYQENDELIMGYKGANEVDAGYYYCPYVPLKISKGAGEEDNVQRLFFHTRYGVAANPQGDKYFRKIALTNLP